MISVSVVIGTNGERSRLRDAVTSLLASTGVDIEVIVVDHVLPSAARWLADIDDDRLRQLSSRTIGVSAARNVGIQAARNDVVLIVDDDVTVGPTWAADFASVLADTPDVAVAFCDVVAGSHDATLGFVPDHVVTASRTVRSLVLKSRVRGIGAGMAVRRGVVLDIGGFDEMLGPGATLHGSEDRDLATRALLHGHAVRSTSEASVTHHGFRTWVEGRALTERDWFGIGATYAKQVKTRDVRIVPVLLVEVLYDGVARPVARLLRGHPPHGLRQIVYFGRGFRAGLAMTVDRRTGVYRTTAKAVVDTAAETVEGRDDSVRRAAPATVVLRQEDDPVGSALVLDSSFDRLDDLVVHRGGDPLPPHTCHAQMITIAICTRDRPLLLARCLESVRSAITMAGDEARAEILVVVNAPTDRRSVDIAHQLGARVEVEPVGGLDVARNRAVSACHTDLIAFVDDDVVVDKAWLRTLVRTFAEHPQVVATTGGVLAYTLDTPARRDFERTGGFSKGWNSAEIRPFERTGGPFDPSIGVGCNMAFRVDALRRIGPFDDALDTGRPLPGGGDLDMLIRAALAGPVRYAPSAIVYHEHRATWSQLRQQYWSWGVSWGAVLHKWYVAVPRHRPAVRRAALDAIRFYGHDLVVGPRDGRRRRVHALLMMTGFIVGSTTAYPRSIRRMELRRDAVTASEAATLPPDSTL